MTLTRTALAALAGLSLAATGCKQQEPAPPVATPIEKPADPTAAVAQAPAAAVEAVPPAVPAEPPPAAPAAAEAAPAAVTAEGAAAPAAAVNPALLDPSKATEQAPATYKVKLTTTEGDIVVQVTRDWAPKGADRFFNLVKLGYFADVSFFRVIPGFMAQFGIHGEPTVNEKWREARIDDDPTGKQSNKRGYLTFAMAGPNTRTTQLFINLVDNPNLNDMGFAPFGQIVEGLDLIDKIHGGYGEGQPRGMGPSQPLVQMQGNAYLKKEFPELDYIKSAAIVP